MKQRFLPWLVPLSLLCLWQISGSFGWLPTRVLPTPSAVLRAGYQLTKSGELAHHIGVSSQRAALGFSIGGVLGLLLGILTGSSRISERLIDSTVQMLRTVPHLALIPLVILWLGVGESAKVFLVALGVMFPV
jgi:sulfonate transport system permease protein